MTASTEPASEFPNLVAALAHVQANLPTVGKTKTAKIPTKNGGEYTYTYADLAEVAAKIHPLLSKAGLAFIAAPTFIDGQYVLVGTLQHTSGDKYEGVFPLPTGDPKQIGSAITYGRRYILSSLTGVVADDDDDGQAAQQNGNSNGRGRGRQQGTPPPESDAAAPTAPSAGLLRARIGQIANERGTSIKDIEADFTGWSQGDVIRTASPDLLTKYIEHLNQGQETSA